MPRLYDQVLGLVGLGNIGRATATRARAFGLEVIAYDRYVQPWLAKEGRVELVGSQEELASRSDFVSMHTPLNDETRRLVGESFFEAMKPTAYFINTSRGGTVDEKALVDALSNGEIAGAGLDVFEEEPAGADNPLFAMDNVIVTPHSAGLSSESLGNAARQMGRRPPASCAALSRCPSSTPKCLGESPRGPRPPTRSRAATEATASAAFRPRATVCSGSGRPHNPFTRVASLLQRRVSRGARGASSKVIT